MKTGITPAAKWVTLCLPFFQYLFFTANLSFLFQFRFAAANLRWFIGVAIGTLSANWLGLLLALILARRKAGGKLWIPFRDVFTDREGLGRFFRVNSDIFFRSAAIMAVSLGVTAIGSRLGALTLAANT